MMSAGAKIVHAGMQNETLCIWAEVGSNPGTEVRLFRVVGTGHGIAETAVHVATFQLGVYVWHIFEIL